MQKTSIKYFRLFFIVVPLFFLVTTALGQENTLPQTLLISYLQELEKKHTIKFSYVDEDIKALKIHPYKNDTLKAVLLKIENDTGVKIKKLDTRYYSLFISNTIDICGTVLDNFKTPLSNVSIEVLDTNIATISDNNGKFSFKKILREAVIQIKHLGFKTKYVSAKNLITKNTCSTVLLKPHYQQLEEVVLIQFLTTGLTKQKDASITLNTKDFGILPGLIEPDVLQTVQALPGIKSIDETVSNINIRGGTNDQNLILWEDSYLLLIPI